MPADIMKDYVPVNERIGAFYEKHPEGSLQSEMVELSETRVVMRGYAYRTPDDPRPGIGYASESIPGRTPYTRFSEVENCETSAWGRAIAALGFEVKRGIATAEDVRNKAEPVVVKANGTPPEDFARSPLPKPAYVTPAPVTAPRSSTAVPPEPDLGWDVLSSKKPEPFGATIAQARDIDGTMTFGELADRAKAANVPVDVLAQTSKKMYGEKAWKLVALTDVQRYAIAVEVGLA